MLEKGGDRYLNQINLESTIFILILSTAILHFNYSYGYDTQYETVNFG